MKENSCPLAFGQLGFLSSSLESRDQALRPTLTVAQRDIKRDSATVSWPQGLHGLVLCARERRHREVGTRRRPNYLGLKAGRRLPTSLFFLTRRAREVKPRRSRDTKKDETEV